MREIGTDLRWGTGWGLFGGIVYMLFAAIVVFFVKGGMSNAPEGITPLTLFGMYPVAGIYAGAVIGLCRPYLKTRLGSMLVGMVAAFVPCIGFLWLAKGPISDWGGVGWFAAVGSAILLGGMGGYILWGQLHDFDPAKYVGAPEE